MLTRKVVGYRSLEKRFPEHRRWCNTALVGERKDCESVPGPVAIFTGGGESGVVVISFAGDERFLLNLPSGCAKSQGVLCLQNQ